MRAAADMCLRQRQVRKSGKIRSTADFSLFSVFLTLSLRYPNNRLENSYSFYLPLFNSLFEKIVLGKKSFGEVCDPLVPPTYAYVGS